jgi:hypothetical protein
VSQELVHQIATLEGHAAALEASGDRQDRLLDELATYVDRAAVRCRAA